VPQRLTADALVYTEYDITDEPLENRDIKKLPAQVQARIDELYALAQHDPTQAIPELERLIATYPHIPTFYNYLGTFHERAKVVDSLPGYTSGMAGCRYNLAPRAKLSRRLSFSTDGTIRPL
jgi:hypothetical protein